MAQSRFWSAVVHGLTPYVPGEQPRIAQLIKLNTNENPYGPSPRALDAIRAETNDSLRLYPDPNASALKSSLATYHGLQPAQVFVGNGSDEVLAHVFLGLLQQPQALWFPDISYSFYPVYCGLYGIRSRSIALDEQYAIRAQDYFPQPEERAGGIIFPNPNAPTGRLLALAAIEEILCANPDAVVVVDEAYIDFGGETAIGLIQRYPNLLVVRTFSKSRALAGLRVGYAVGDAGLIEALERVKNSFNSYPLDRLALAGALASIEDEAHFSEICAKVIASRERLTLRLSGLGFEVLPSSANFVFARHPAHDAAKLAQALREQAILVRHFAKPRIDQHLRITIGTEAECERLVEALEAILSA